MSNAKLTQTQIDALIAKLQLYKYAVSYGSTVLGPLASAPSVSPDVETEDIMLYETGADAQASIISKNNATIELEVEDVATALGMLVTFKKGDNILATAKSAALTFVPLTDDEDAETLTFPNVFLNAGLSFTPGEGTTPNAVPLTFTAKESSAGVLFTYA